MTVVYLEAAVVWLLRYTEGKMSYQATECPINVQFYAGERHLKKKTSKAESVLLKM